MVWCSESRARRVFETAVLLRLCVTIGALVLPSLQAADSTINAVVSCPTVPPGGTAQITVTLAAPMSITHGKFHIELDPAVFGDISAVQVFSASGDQQGIAKLQGTQADVVFNALSGGIGLLPNLPVAEITAPVLATVRVGSIGSVTVQATSLWRGEVSGQQYSMAFQSKGVPIGPGLSIQSVVPGGGPVPAGTLVQVNGQGFTSSTMPDASYQ